MIKVVCGVFLWGELVFVGRRKPGLMNSGLWEFPGGKVENGESETEALRREIFEELGSEAIIKYKIAESTLADQMPPLSMSAYLCEFKNDPKSSADHDLIRWVEWENLMEYPMPDLDIPIAQRVVDLYHQEDIP